MSLLDFFKKKKPDDIGDLKGAELELPTELMDDQAAAAGPAVEDLEVKVMPQKFIGLRVGKVKRLSKKRHETAEAGVGEARTKLAKPSASPLKRNLIIGIVSIVLIGGVMALVAFFVVRGLESDTEADDLALPEPPFSITQPPPEPPPPLKPLCLSCDTLACPEGCVLDEQSCWTSGQCLVPFELPLPEDDLDFEDEFGGTDGADGAADLFAADDLDSDGLTEAEELIFGSDPFDPDSDDDSYLDGAEIKNLYDPNFGDQALLRDSNRLRTFVSSEFAYRLLVPVAWTEEIPGELSEQIRFVAGTQEFFTVIVEPNFEAYDSARDWYLDQFPGQDPTLLTSLSPSSLNGILSADGLAAYFAAPEYIYTLSYNPGIRQALNFQTTFEMFVASFSLFENPLD